MVTPELVTYIWTERKKGVADHIIKAYLATQGWSEADFKEAASALPPPHTAIDPKMSGDLLRQLGENVVWRTPDGKADLPAKPIIRQHKGIVKATLFVLFFLILALSVYIYRGSLWDTMMDYYKQAEPTLAKIGLAIIMATDFSK
jgi:hypothetical protein